MNVKNSSSALISTRDSFWESLQKNKNNFYFASNYVEFSHNTLHDGFSNPKKYFLLAEKLYMEEYLKKNNINYNNSEFVTYKAKFSWNRNFSCSGNIHVLGRYFSQKYLPHLVNNSPRARLASDIYSCKKSFDTFLEWNSHLVNSLENILSLILRPIEEDEWTWDAARMELVKQKASDSTFIVTSVPNANGENRFSSFLNKMKSNNEKVIYADNFFVQKKEVNTFRLSYSDKMANLNNLYKVNPKMETLFQKNTQIVIIDDVLTSGAHFEECLRALKDSKILANYQVHGLFLAATQSNNTSWKSGLEYSDSGLILHAN